jgi:sulfofructose kinase
MPHILCAGIVVLDEVFRVREFPPHDGKVEASEFITVLGGSAANAAIAVARLGGKVRLASPLGGPAGDDAAGDRLVDGLRGEGVDCTGCVRVSGARTSVSAIFINQRGDRNIANYRDHRLDSVLPDDPDGLVADVDALLVDNRFPDFVAPICRAARHRRIPIIVDADMPIDDRHPLFTAATHVIFSAECLRATARTTDLAAGLAHMGEFTDAFLAVTNGAAPVLWRDGRSVRELPVFAVEAVDTLGAGDVFHGAFALGLVEQQTVETAMRFAAAAAGLKCSRFGGSMAAPRRAEVDALLAKN